MDKKVVSNHRSIDFYYLIREEGECDRMEMMEIKEMEIKLARGREGRVTTGAIIRWGEASCTWHRYEGEVSYQVGRTGEGKGREGKEKGDGEVSLSFSPSHDISRISYNLQCYGDFMYILAELRSPALRSII